MASIYFLRHPSLIRVHIFRKNFSSGAAGGRSPLIAGPCSCLKILDSTAKGRYPPRTNADGSRPIPPTFAWHSLSVSGEVDTERQLLHMNGHASFAIIWLVTGRSRRVNERSKITCERQLMAGSRRRSFEPSRLHRLGRKAEKHGASRAPYANMRPIWYESGRRHHGVLSTLCRAVAVT